jgi:hypothetical protein
MSSYRSFNFQQLPWMFNRPEISCFDSAGNHYLDGGPGHGAYLWNTGAVTRIIQVTQPDTFVVFVPYGNGGFISGEKFIVSDLQNPCSATTAVSFLNGKDEMLAYPNPAGDRLEIEFPEPVMNTHPSFSICCYNQLGEKINSVAYLFSNDGRKIKADVSSLPCGIYYLGIISCGKSFAARFIKS